MKSDHRSSEEMLNAFVDNELATEERAHLVSQLSQDADIKKRVCELHMLKDMVRVSYRQSQPEVDACTTSSHFSLRRCALACSLLVVGLLAGWLGHWRYADTSGMHMVSLNNVIASPDNILVHVDSSSPAVFERALDRVELLLAEAQREHRDIQVQLLANGQGMDLFRTSTSPYAERLHQMRQRYQNLRLIGCGQTIKRLRDYRQDARILPDVDVVPAVLDEIVNGLGQGWSYLKA